MSVFYQIFWVRHETENGLACIEDTGDVADRAVWIGAFSIPECHLAVTFDARQRVGIGEVVAVVVRDRAANDLARGIAPGESGIGIGDGELDFTADEFERSV